MNTTPARPDTPSEPFALIVDDAVPIRKLLEDQLENSADVQPPLPALGVGTAAEAEQALARARNTGQRVLMLLLDGQFPFGDDRDNLPRTSTSAQAVKAAFDAYNSGLAADSQAAGQPVPKPGLLVYIGLAPLAAVGLDANQFDHIVPKGMLAPLLGDLAREARS